MTEPAQVSSGLPGGASGTERSAASAASSKATRQSSPSSPRLPFASLLEIARELGNLLIPVEPSAEFRIELHRRLVVEARRQQDLRSLSSRSDRAAVSRGGAVVYRDGSAEVMRQLSGEDESSNRRWIIGAAAVGSASLLGLLVYVRSRRHARAA
jgi:hypothetical protein